MIITDLLHLNHCTRGTDKRPAKECMPAQKQHVLRCCCCLSQFFFLRLRTAKLGASADLLPPTVPSLLLRSNLITTLTSVVSSLPIHLRYFSLLLALVYAILPVSAWSHSIVVFMPIPTQVQQHSPSQLGTRERATNHSGKDSFSLESCASVLTILARSLDTVVMWTRFMSAN